jgi:hypothetical protein
MGDFFKWIYDGLCKIYETAYNAVYAAFKYIYDWILEIGDWLWRFVNFLYEWFWEDLNSLVDWFFVLGMSSLSVLVDLLPSYDMTALQPSLDVFVYSVSLVNCVAPVEELFYCVVVYVTLLVVWVVYKFIKSWIPFFSGT